MDAVVFWMNELLAWEDCIVWAEYGIDEPGKIMKFDLAKKECIVLYETEENLMLFKWGEEVLFYGEEDSNGCLINLTGKEEKLVEFNVKENAIYTVYEKTEDKGYSGILSNGEDEWYISFNSRLHGGKGEILIKSLPASD